MTYMNLFVAVLLVSFHAAKSQNFEIDGFSDGSPDHMTVQDSVPSDFIGQWAGHAYEADYGEWPFNIHISPGKQGTIVGTVKYPSLKCGGTLTLEEVGPNRIYLRERINKGVFSCINMGLIELALQGEAISFHWTHPNHMESEAKGLLAPEIKEKR